MVSAFNSRSYSGSGLTQDKGHRVLEQDAMTLLSTLVRLLTVRPLFFCTKIGGPSHWIVEIPTGVIWRERGQKYYWYRRGGGGGGNGGTVLPSFGATFRVP